MTRSRSLGVFFVCVASLACIASACAQRVPVDPDGKSIGGLDNALVFGGSEPQPLITCPGPTLHTFVPCSGATGEGITSARSGPEIAGQPLRRYPNQYGLDFYTAASPRVSISHEGLVGIGTQMPASLLDLKRSGNVDIGMTSADGAGRRWILRSGGQSLAGAFQIVDGNTARIAIDDAGLVSVKTIRIMGGSDISEPFKTSAPVPVGAVVSIDPGNAGALKLSDRPYDRRVAGIVSGAGGVKPGLTLEQLDAKGGTQQIALSGRVYALANTSSGAIRAGDLLTTSGIPGQAMRATKIRRAQGAIIGKAMTPLKSGFGMVLVLVSIE